MIVRQYRSHDGDFWSEATATETDRESDMTQQQFREEVDINVIVERFGGMAPHVEGAVYGDFTGITDFESALDRVARATADFMRLPAAVRDKYGNSPAEFLRTAGRLELSDETGELFVKRVEEDLQAEAEAEAEVSAAPAPKEPEREPQGGEDPKGSS